MKDTLERIRCCMRLIDFVMTPRIVRLARMCLSVLVCAIWSFCLGFADVLLSCLPILLPFAVLGEVNTCHISGHSILRYEPFYHVVVIIFFTVKINFKIKEYIPFKI